MIFLEMMIFLITIINKIQILMLIQNLIHNKMMISLVHLIKQIQQQMIIMIFFQIMMIFLVVVQIIQIIIIIIIIQIHSFLDQHKHNKDLLQ